jgi:hypothetical protein
MQFARVIQSRNVRAWGVLIVFALLVILIAAVFLQCRRSSQPFEMDHLYAYWIKLLPDVGTDHTR